MVMPRPAAFVAVRNDSVCDPACSTLMVYSSHSPFCTQPTAPPVVTSTALPVRPPLVPPCRPAWSL